MKFSTTALLSFAAVASANWNSPAAGQDLKIGEKFTLDWTVARYFKESPGTITVLLSNGDFGAGKSATRLVDNLDYKEWAGSYNATYNTELTANPGYGGQAGAYQLVILETFNGYGSPAFEYYTLDVNLVN
ncbi:hypothetical protein CYLTODRAFT_491637 [Cylindrobasidium torrendii FP15055 ss-10]|uniref:Yeast cell wall synthesis Kre9/Knh1-like N-terminal domain-containing protein n=1 Tax=Cylindrobasidium torrendii FP15055 ss-10 TaxID=1314674 RepID=A0A0D7B708_9AGAR|nr:hypothetical protein CYLTODRAFT_491637 [Cylindrobasidium torrendii FP15055 ss-10]